ncbi:MAG: sulfatase-like hydrolase/transferase, partial [Akkermansiaceae bacterium]
RVAARYLTAATGLTMWEVKNDPAKARDLYRSVYDKIRIKDATGRDMAWVESACNLENKWWRSNSHIRPLLIEVLDLLKELDIDEETLVLFNADNGAETVHVDWMRQDHDHDASGGWRGMKRDGWEGGHRVPFIARWPGRIPKGQVSKQMTNTTDIMATIASLVGYKLPDDAATDSFDMLPVMIGRQGEKNPVRPHLLTQSFRGEFQIRKGNWKYLDHKGSGGNGYEKGNLKKYSLNENEPKAPGQLYNLTTDPGETANLYFKEETIRLEMQKLLKRLKESGRSAPLGREPIGMAGIPKAK